MSESIKNHEQARTKVRCIRPHRDLVAGQVYDAGETHEGHIKIFDAKGGFFWWSADRFEALVASAHDATNNVALPTDPKERKNIPMVQGLLDYFPAALAAVSDVSRIGNEQHNPGQPMHHARGKSTDHADCIVRHLLDRGTVDTDGARHSAKVAWRALALLQEELEAAGAPLARGARLPEEKVVSTAEPILNQSVGPKPSPRCKRHG
jgi:hypothetical protein